MKEYTKRRNLNRGYMKLEVWNNGIEIFQYSFNLLKEIRSIDYKLKSQMLDAAQSISSNIAEGYCRRSITEYLHFLNIALGSTGELLTRMIGLKEINFITDKVFDEFDQKHYEVENKLLALIKSLQTKQKNDSWDQQIHEPKSDYLNTPKFQDSVIPK